MATRPIFSPSLDGPTLVRETTVSFHWHPGLSAAQKKRNVAALHLAAAAEGVAPLLEVSSKSELELGRSLSAFVLPFPLAGVETTVEAVFQGSKRFAAGGPYTDLYAAGSRAAKADGRLRDSGPLVAFELEGVRYPLDPPTAFYDWIYLRALAPHRDRADALAAFAGFSDIEFNPARSINCQARACAIFVALQQRGWLAGAVQSFGTFVARMTGAAAGIE